MARPCKPNKTRVRVEAFATTLRGQLSQTWLLLSHHLPEKDGPVYGLVHDAHLAQTKYTLRTRPKNLLVHTVLTQKHFLRAI